jgi:hypothetical protein
LNGGSDSSINTDQQINNELDEQQQPSIELQNILEKQSKELTEMKHKFNETLLKIKEYEDKLKLSEEKSFNLSKEFLLSQELNKKYQRDLKENLAQKDDQEQRISTLEQRYVNSQRECTALHDLNNRLETELAIKDNSHKHVRYICNTVFFWKEFRIPPTSNMKFFLYHSIRFSSTKKRKNTKKKTFERERDRQMILNFSESVQREVSNGIKKFHI